MSVTVNSMRDQVADLIGGSGDSTASSKAIELINRAIDHLNMNGLVLIKRKESTKTSDASDFANGAQSVTLPTDWGWPSDRVCFYDSSNNLVAAVEYRPWEQMRSFINDLDTTNYGTPAYVSIQSSTLDNKLYFWPFIDTSKVAKIIIPYFTRVATVNAGEVWGETREIGEAIIAYAQFLIMQYRYKDKPAIWAPWKGFADEAMRRAKASTYRDELGASGWHVGAIPDETGMVAHPTDFFPRGAVYIVVGGN